MANQVKTINSSTSRTNNKRIFVELLHDGEKMAFRVRTKTLISFKGREIVYTDNLYSPETFSALATIFSDSLNAAALTHEYVRECLLKSKGFTQETNFGFNYLDDNFTPKDMLEKISKEWYSNVHIELCKEFGEVIPNWEDCSDDFHNMILSMVGNVYQGHTTDPQSCHEVFLQHRISDGWKFSDRYNFEEKKSPRISYYSKLSLEDKDKIDTFYEVVSELCNQEKVRQYGIE